MWRISGVIDGVLVNALKERIAVIVNISNRLAKKAKRGMYFAGDADYNLKRFGYSDETHSWYNFSILPGRGGINTKKGARYGYNEQLRLFLADLKK